MPGWSKVNLEFIGHTGLWTIFEQTISLLTEEMGENSSEARKK